MVKVDASLWTVLIVVGMILLAAGALTVMLVPHPEVSASAIFMVAGIAFIVISAVFINIDGRKLRKDDEEFRRFEKIRDEVRYVPDNLEEGYLIDYTASEIDGSISYRNNEREQIYEEYPEESSDDDVVIIYSN